VAAESSEVYRDGSRQHFEWFALQLKEGRGDILVLPVFSGGLALLRVNCRTSQGGKPVASAQAAIRSLSSSSR